MPTNAIKVNGGIVNVNEWISADGENVQLAKKWWKKLFAPSDAPFFAPSVAPISAFLSAPLGHWSSIQCLLMQIWIKWEERALHLIV